MKLNKIWLRSYPEGIPADINPDEYDSLVEIFEHCCSKFRERIAYENYGVKLSYAELEQKSRYFANFLQQQLGLIKGDRVALMMPNILQYPIAMFGAIRAGLVVVNINPLYTPRELCELLQDSGAKAMVVMSKFAQTVEAVLAKTHLEHIIVTSLGDLFPYPKSFIVNFIVKHFKGGVPAWCIPQAITFDHALSVGSELMSESVLLKGDDLAYLQYTGGTTGAAKGAELTHRNIVANLLQIKAWLKPLPAMHQSKKVITALPLYHIFSLTANCLTFMEIGGHNILITDPRDMKSFVNILKRHQFHVITGVDTLFNALTYSNKFKQLDFSLLELALAGGMAVKQDVAQRWMEITKKPLLQAYGLTEASPGVCITPLTANKFSTSVGVPLPSTDLQIRNDVGEQLGPDHAGELCIHGPQVMRGYWQKPEETASALRHGWLYTGDIAKMDDAGYVYLLERKKDLIIISGFNVYPNEIEDVIAQHPSVLEAAVIGVTDQSGNEQIKACVVKKDKILTTTELIKFCQAQLTAYKVPKLIEFYDSLPKSNIGKILRKDLRK